MGPYNLPPLPPAPPEVSSETFTKSYWQRWFIDLQAFLKKFKFAVVTANLGLTDSFQIYNNTGQTDAGGSYLFTFPTKFGSVPNVVATPLNIGAGQTAIMSVGLMGNGQVKVESRNSAGAFVPNVGFSIIAIGTTA